MAAAPNALTTIAVPLPMAPALSITPLRKAAILIMTLGEEASKALLRGLAKVRYSG